MLSKEENDLLTQVSNGAPMGRMLKQHWWVPAALSEKLQADGAPQRIRLFGDNYVAFRATDGNVGFFDEACPHRGASMALARNENNSLRCIYHGWRFTVEGVTVEVPTQPNNEAEYCKHVPLKHYATREAAGVVWVWLGEGEQPPAFQEFAFAGLPASHTVAFRQKVPCNYLQGIETTMDSAHLGVLHQSYVAGLGAIQFAADNKAPVYQVEQKPYGFRYAAIRELPEGKSYVRTNSFVLPWYGVISPSTTDSNGGNFFFSVPIDDENTWYWHITFQIDKPLQLKPSHLYTDPDNWPPLPPGDGSNNWGQNRHLMQLGHFTGFPQSLGTEDFAVITSQGSVVDRTKEYLGAGDGAVVNVRRCLLNSVREFQQGKVPTLAQHEAIAYPQIRPISQVFDGEPLWKDML